MILQASNGCLLTQSEDVSIKDRRFEKSMLVASIEEANKWKEIPESDRDRIIVESKLFEPDRVDYDYLTKVNKLMTSIEEKINNNRLSPAQALTMQKYYPQWEKCIGRYASEGFRCNYNGTLVEVVTSHTISSDNPPIQNPMLLALNTDNMEEQSIPVQYYKPVAAEKHLHTKYSANPDGNPMTEIPNKYIGIYQDYFEEDSDNPTDYLWSELQGHADPVGKLGEEGCINEENMSNE